MSRPGAPRTTDEGSIPGVAPAIVADTEDPKDRGRVKLRYPWLDTDGESHWARIAVAMAGADRGTYLPPEEGDEVLVAFEDGDLDHPYVLGGLWNGADEPPETDGDGPTDVRLLRSRSGHELAFDDRDADGAVRIETAGGHSVVLSDGDDTVTIEGSGGNTVEFDSSSGSLSITSEATVSIEAPTVEISSSGNLDIEAGGVLTLDGALIRLN